MTAEALTPQDAGADSEPILSLRGIQKSFGAVHVLRGVDLEVHRGRVTALVGDNGAGKSTLIKGIAGIHGFDEGEYLFEGRPVTVHGPRDANALGIEVVYQDLALCDNLDVVHNMFLGRELGSVAALDEDAMEARARKRVNQGEKTALFRIMEERGRDRLSSGIWERALARDDHMAIDLLEEAVEALGAGVASAVNLLDPEAVVIGGGLGIRLGEPWVQRIREAMHPHLFVDDDPPPVLLAELGDLGGAHGGALLAARRAMAKT